MPVKGDHLCYLLYSPSTNSTYNGYTIDMQRRIRQHNRQIAGGAKGTSRASDWEIIAIFHSPEWTKCTAMSFEWTVRYPTRKKPRPREFAALERFRSFPMICCQYSYPIQIEILEQYKGRLDTDTLPENVSVSYVQSLPGLYQ